MYWNERTRQGMSGNYFPSKLFFLRIHLSEAMSAIDRFPLASLCSTWIKKKEERKNMNWMKCEWIEFPCKESTINSCCCHLRGRRGFDCQCHLKVCTVWATAETQLLWGSQWDTEGKNTEIKPTAASCSLTDDGCHFASVTLNLQCWATHRQSNWITYECGEKISPFKLSLRVLL